ncbi:ABC transporter permease [Actinospica robiniae]|uniref:ABC transporter permease n=1 Tax=Actinospica robiniae TaxID=304901 RepID=UPI0005505C59|nr:ABC transporter permease [Actinospica robiniae]
MKAGRPRGSTVIAAVGLALVVLAALRPSVLASGDPDAVNVLQAFRGPGFAHWFGTDQLGRDEYTRVVYGARLSLTVGLGATVLATAAATLLGLAAGLGGRVVGAALGRVFDVFLAFPGLLLALLVLAVLGSGTGQEILAIALAATPGLARLVRARVLEVRGAGYIDAAVILGLGRGAILRRHLLPAALRPLLVLVTVGIAESILAGAALSFLGLGPAEPAAEWGSMLAQGRDYLALAWWTGIIPGLAIAATVVAATVLGRAAQRAARRRTG